MICGRVFSIVLKSGDPQVQYKRELAALPKQSRLTSAAGTTAPGTLPWRPMLWVILGLLLLLLCLRTPCDNNYYLCVSEGAL